MKKIIILLLLISLYGCAYVFQNFNEKISEIKLDMSREEVKNSWGEPLEIKILKIEGKEYEVWKYPSKKISSSKFNPLGTNYYEILFFEGKVAHCNKVKIYAQPEYDFKQAPTPEGKVKTYKFFGSRNVN